MGGTRGSRLVGVTTVGPAQGTGLTAREAEVLALVGPAPDERADRRRAVHLGAHGREPRVGAAAQAAAAGPPQPGPARRPRPGAAGRVRPARACRRPLTPFVGRRADRAALAAALAEHRLVTAPGPGGVGKTRLALSVAAELAQGRRDGAWFVDLVR